ncbi:MAG: KH domain-containing protein [Armatimonadota bacterium]
MKAVLEVIVRGLVDEPERVRVRETVSGSRVTYDISVSERDLGKVIGRDGRIANALRTVVSALAARQNREAQVEIQS